MNEEMYAILGVPKCSSAKEIRDAYRRLAMKNHPDRGGSSAKMKAIQSAYDILGNASKRAYYDKTGSGDIPNPEKEANALLMSLFNLALDDESFTGDIVKQADKLLSSKMSGLRLEIERIQRKQFILEKKQGRVKSKSENLYEQLLSSKIAENTKLREEMSGNLEVFQIAGDKLKDYEDTKPTTNGFEDLMTQPTPWLRTAL